MAHARIEFGESYFALGLVFGGLALFACLTVFLAGCHVDVLFGVSVVIHELSRRSSNSLV